MNTKMVNATHIRAEQVLSVATMTNGDKLMQEFMGERITRKVAAALAMRIDGLISIAESAERHRCCDIARDAWGKIINSNAHPPTTQSGQKPLVV